MHKISFDISKKKNTLSVIFSVVIDEKSCWVIKTKWCIAGASIDFDNGVFFHKQDFPISIIFNYFVNLI